MKTLVVFYSRTGNTRKIAELITYDLDAQMEEIDEEKSRSGLWGYLLSCREAYMTKYVDINQPVEEVANYDLVVIGSPVWVSSVSSPVRSYLTMNRAKLPQVAFFCTMGGRGASQTFTQMQEICWKPPLATLALNERQLRDGNVKSMVNDFALALQHKWNAAA